jgi:hypothetical protein
MRRQLKLIAIAAALAAAPMAVHAYGGGAFVAKPNLDRKYIKDSLADSAAALADSRLAERRGSPAVQALARQIEANARAIAAEAGAAARRAGIAVPAKAAEPDAALAAAPAGAAFDRLYLVMWSTEYELGLAATREEMAHGSFTPVRRFAGEAMVQLHHSLGALHAAS